jgi:hypothetical protein
MFPAGRAFYRAESAQGRDLAVLAAAVYRRYFYKTVKMLGNMEVPVNLAAAMHSHLRWVDSFFVHLEMYLTADCSRLAVGSTPFNLTQAECQPLLGRLPQSGCLSVLQAAWAASGAGRYGWLRHARGSIHSTGGHTYGCVCLDVPLAVLCSDMLSSSSNDTSSKCVML